MTSLPQKRSLSSEATIPAEDCTRDTFDQHANLSDRQFLSWALQTEARVRFSKLQGRAAAGSDSSNAGRDTTLNSDYLIDVYPDAGDISVTEGKLARERHAFARKSIPYLQTTKDLDSSFETLTRLDIRRSQSQVLKETTSDVNKLPVPPNLLFFEIVLEAYMGYRVPTFRSNDPTLPSAAIMGGAVVASLSSWRDPHVIASFDDSEKDLAKALESDNVEKYESTKTSIMHLLHGYFLASHGRSESPFSLGDVDIFLQASPLRRSLADKLQDLPAEVQDIVGNFLGGSGHVFEDLHRYARGLCDEYLLPMFRNFRGSRYSSTREFCYALATNGLSFALGTEDMYDGEGFDVKKDRWPRPTQLIMLNEKADLVGGLMDFDISTASCAYNGVSVYVTHRAAFSLKTLTQVVTPFVFEEKRNRTRIAKYYERGFDAFIIDPYCSHESLCCENGSALTKESAEASQIVRVAKWRSSDLTSWERYQEICEAQIALDDSQMICVCQKRHDEGTWFDQYSVALFEKSKGHAIEYFAKRDDWTDEFRNEVLECPEARLIACRYCRNEYGLQLVLDEAPPSIKSAETVDDVLHGELSYVHGDFGPSFYSGGAISSKYVGVNARATYQLMGVMRSQQRLEKARYIRKYGSPDGYKDRFVYGDDLESVFQEAVKGNLPANGRAPVGLNPERFIAKCKGCKQWLHGREYNVQYCEDCEETKPAAVED